MVRHALNADPMDPQRVERAVHAFVASLGEYNYGGWTHSLSHFTPRLWHLRMTDLLIEIYRVTFERMRSVLDRKNCANRIVGHFCDYAIWSDDPAMFSLRIEELDRWMNWEYYGMAKARIEHGPFESGPDFLEWKIRTLSSQIAQAKSIYCLSEEFVRTWKALRDEEEPTGGLCSEFPDNH